MNYVECSDDVLYRAGREWSDWSQELRVTGDELRWKFTSDGSVNGWGWRFVVYPIMPSSAPLSMMSDRTVLSRPSIDLATCLLDLRLQTSLAPGGASVRRLTAALAACAQLGSLSKSASVSASVGPVDSSQSQSSSDLQQRVTFHSGPFSAFCENMTSSTNQKYVTYCMAVKRGPSRGLR